MDALRIEIKRADPTHPEFEDLFERHLTLMRASSPACSVHAKPASGLSGEHVHFFAGFQGNTPVAMGAVQDLGEGLFEIKSMHVLDTMRGKGLAREMLGVLIEDARDRGAHFIKLETGSQPAFEPARGLYAAAGFEPCPPFADYTDDPNSFYMSCELA